MSARATSRVASISLAVGADGAIVSADEHVTQLVFAADVPGSARGTRTYRRSGAGTRRRVPHAAVWLPRSESFPPGGGGCSSCWTSRAATTACLRCGAGAAGAVPNRTGKSKTPDATSRSQRGIPPSRRRPLLCPRCRRESDSPRGLRRLRDWSLRGESWPGCRRCDPMLPVAGLKPNLDICGIEAACVLATVNVRGLAMQSYSALEYDFNDRGTADFSLLD